jgi:hypothetical protein
MTPPAHPAGVWKQLAAAIQQLASSIPTPDTSSITNALPTSLPSLPAAPELHMPALPQLPDLPTLPAFPAMPDLTALPDLPHLPDLPRQQALADLLASKQSHWGSTAAAKGLASATEALTQLLDAQGITPAVAGALQQLQAAVQQSLAAAPAPVVGAGRLVAQLAGLLATAAAQLGAEASATAEELHQHQLALQAQLGQVRALRCCS